MNAFSLKRMLCLGAALGALAAGPALASDDPASTGYNYNTGSNYSSARWSGPYVGGFVGGTWSDFRNNPGTAGPSGNDTNLMGGGDIGNNWQFDRLVVGAEGDFAKFNNHSGTGSGVKFTEDWMSTARGRVGYAFGRFLPYLTGGLAMTDTVAKVSGVGSASQLELGPAAGAGVDTMLSDNWFGRIEYLYTDVPKDASTIGGTTIDGGSNNHTLRVGLNYKF